MKNVGTVVIVWDGARRAAAQHAPPVRRAPRPVPCGHHEEPEQHQNSKPENGGELRGYDEGDTREQSTKQ